MSGVIDFTGTEAASSKPYTRPGTIDVFKITKADFESSKNTKKPYLKLTFENKDSMFSHSFFLAGKDADSTKKVLSRIQYMLVTIHGESGKLTGKITEEQIKLKLVGKEIGLKVSGEVSDQGKGFATLSFSGFASKPEEVQFLSFNKQEQQKIDEALEAIDAARSEKADVEPGGGYEGGITESYGNTKGSEHMQEAPPQSENF